MAKHWDFDTRFPSGNADVRHLLKDGKPRRRSATDSDSVDLLNSDAESLDISAESRIARLSSEGDTQETP